MKLIHNATIYTADSSFSKVGAMVFDKGIIIETGDYKILKDRYEDAVPIDAKGRAILPGFIDPHIHFLIGAFSNGSFDCTPEKVPDIERLKSRLHEVAQTTPEGLWVVGQGYDPVKYHHHRQPSRYDLDEACPNQPAMIIHYSLHEVILNSEALRLIGVDRLTPQPAAGVIEKDRKGEPTGRLIESISGKAISIALGNWIECSGDRLFNQIKIAEQLLFSFGVTRVGDPAVSTREWALYEHLYRHGVLQLPVVAYPANDGNMYDLPVAKADNKRGGSHEEMPILGPVKFFLDGSDRAAVRLNILQGVLSVARTCIRMISRWSMDPLRIMLRSPFFLGHDFKLHFGVRMAKTPDLKRCVNKAVMNGHPVAFHAIGNEAIEQAVQVMNTLKVRYTHPAPPRIEHALFPSERDIQLIQQAGMAIATQPAFLSHMGSDNLPPIKGLKMLPLRSYIDAGIHVSGSSDWPVVSCNPLIAIERAVTRKTLDGETLDPVEAITVKEAIRMYTWEAAYLLGQTDRIGSLEPGKRADFIILNQDPLKEPPGNISAIHVEKTYLHGELVFSR